MFAKLQEEIAAETKSLKSEEQEEPVQDGSKEKRDESLKNDVEDAKEKQAMPNGDVVQDEDEGVDLRGKYAVHQLKYWLILSNKSLSREVF